MYSPESVSVLAELSRVIILVTINRCAFYRSTGVLLYVFLVGLSPFLGATENETCANIEAAAYAIPTSASVSEHSLDLISKLLAANPQKRLSASKALAHCWIKASDPERSFFHISS